MIQPGSTIGILGGGQLGRMLILAGRELGYRFHVFEPSGSPESPSPAGRIAEREWHSSYEDETALRDFAESVDVITLEFENIPTEAIDILEAVCPVAPKALALATCQHRQREKDFLKDANLPHTPFAYAASAAELEQAVTAVGFPCVIKTATFGYDGKGQIKLRSAEEAKDCGYLWDYLGAPDRVVVEQWIQHIGEFSIVCARKADGTTSTFPMSENIHVDHILHASIVPARISAATQRKGETIAKTIADQLEVVGLIAVEFFLTEDGDLIVNEMAPRPHNSGHYTIDACRTSQFEQHIRSICDLPLGSTKLIEPCVMINLLGDCWQSDELDVSALLKNPDLKLHLYDKGTPRSGRKMGHFSLLGEDIDSLLEEAENIFSNLKGAES